MSGSAGDVLGLLGPRVGVIGRSPLDRGITASVIDNYRSVPDIPAESLGPKSEEVGCQQETRIGHDALQITSKRGIRRVRNTFIPPRVSGKPEVPVVPTTPEKRRSVELFTSAGWVNPWRQVRIYLTNLTHSPYLRRAETATRTE